MTNNAKLVPVGHPNRPGTKLDELLAVVVHYTANDAPTATDTANASYFGRQFWKSGNDYFEADRVTPFRYGSAHVIIDEDSVTMAIPTDEVAWACGDRHKLPWSEVLRGQTPLARNVFGFRQNYRTISVEICNNRSWDKAVANAQAWISDFLRGKDLKVAARCSMVPQLISRKDFGPKEVLIVRHFDVTGKMCPKPFVDDPRDWQRFVDAVAKGAL